MFCGTAKFQDKIQSFLEKKKKISFPIVLKIRSHPNVNNTASLPSPSEHRGTFPKSLRNSICLEGHQDYNFKTHINTNAVNPKRIKFQKMKPYTYCLQPLM